MVKIQNRITLGLKLLEYFTLRNWKFNNKQALSLNDQLEGTDKEEFVSKNAVFDIDMFLINSQLGSRKYCLKEDLKSLPYCRVHIKL